MSTTLLFGQIREGVESEHDVVRSTTFTVQQDQAPAMQSGPPEMDEVETDPNPSLGIVNRQKASYVFPTEKYAPFWQNDPEQQSDATNSVNRRIASDGDAAHREASGTFGHGTLQVTDGIEPVQDLQGHGGFGADYFTVDKKDAQESAVSQIGSPVLDQDTASSVLADGKTKARQASAAGTFEAFYASVVGGNR